MWAWFAKPFVPYLVGAVGMAGVALWFNTQYVSSDEYQALAADLQRVQQERNDAEMRVKRQAEEYAEKSRKNRELYQQQLAKNTEFHRRLDSLRDRLQEIDSDPDVQAARARLVPPAIVSSLREFPASFIE